MSNIGQPERATQQRIIHLFRDELEIEPTHNARFVAVDGPLHAQLAVSASGAQSPTGSARGVELTGPQVNLGAHR